MKNKKFLTIALMLLTTTLSGYASPGEEGKTIFMSRCAGCHNVNKIVTGPALAGIDNRRPIEWIIKFVHSSQSVVKSGDPYAVSLFEKFNKIQMPDHADLTEDNIKSIVAYVKSASGNPSPNASPNIPSGVIVNLPISEKNYMAIIIYFVAVLMLMAALLAAVHVKDLQHKYKKIDEYDF